MAETIITADQGVQDTYYTLMKDDLGVIYFYEFNPSVSSPSTQYQEIRNNADINQLSFITSSGSLENFYYAVDNK